MAEGSSRPFWLLALMIGSATIGMHIFVPALPMITKEFAIKPAQAQLTISLYMFVIAGGQIFYGPLSDRFGRRPVLLGALTIFGLAGLAAAAAQSFEALLTARLFQAAGGCAGLVLGRAVVHDTAHGGDAARTIAAVNAVLLISPTLAPIIGVWMVNTLGWRSIPLLLAILGVATIAGVAFRLTETAASRAEPARAIWLKYRALLVSHPFLLQVLGGSLTTTTMFVLLATSPFVVLQYLHRPIEEAAAFYAVFVIGLLAGNVSASFVARCFGLHLVFIGASCLGTIGAGLFLTAVLTGTLTTPVFLGAGFLYTLMSGTMAPLTLTHTVSLSPHLRGSATGIFGAAQFTVGAIAVSIASASSDIARMAAVVLLACAGSGLALYATLYLRRRHRRIKPA
ncbi:MULTISPECIES: MFS transporter [unclassified Chelatococcus]|uniref:MFS transporter n=1 Tax=unclassified Chelatococcus TaxID=2638111 RepID=UPI001BCF1703|nr:MULTISPECIES: MFS transporter [unclassified Chelatococcus]MBS7700236.1 MFS transporter [Chelatococcus sp. YT9]MBX3558207.1 MFS transporter [Chelatococcus sp.]